MFLYLASSGASQNRDGRVDIAAERLRRRHRLLCSKQAADITELSLWRSPHINTTTGRQAGGGGRGDSRAGWTGGRNYRRRPGRLHPSPTPVFSPATKPNSVSSCRNASVNPAEGLCFTERLRPTTDKQLAEILSSLTGRGGRVHCETVKLLMTVIISPMLLLHEAAPEQEHRLPGG